MVHVGPAGRGWPRHGSSSRVGRSRDLDVTGDDPPRSVGDGGSIACRLTPLTSLTLAWTLPSEYYIYKYKFGMAAECERQDCGQWREAGEPGVEPDDRAGAHGSRAEPLAIRPVVGLSTFRSRPSTVRCWKPASVSAGCRARRWGSDPRFLDDDHESSRSAQSWH
jgi:hypothetical protein